MKDRLLELKTIRDYILKHFPETLWWDGFNKHERFDSQHSYKHRQGMPNEIRIEFDSKDLDKNWEDINFTAIKLNEEGYSFAIFSVDGGRSPHLHIYDLDELETLSYDQRTTYRNKFLTKICPKGSEPDKGLSDEKHLCALEFANHFKHKNPKKLLSYFWNGRNQGIDFDLKMEVLEGERTKKKIVIKEKPLKFGDQLKLKRSDFIKSKLSFEQVFDKYEVDYRGHMALCPFHADKDRSLSFSNEKSLWKCFGCEEKGDIITLVRKLKELKDGDKK